MDALALYKDLTNKLRVLAYRSGSRYKNYELVQISYKTFESSRCLLPLYRLGLYHRIIWFCLYSGFISENINVSREFFFHDIFFFKPSTKFYMFLYSVYYIIVSSSLVQTVGFFLIAFDRAYSYCDFKF